MNIFFKKTFAVVVTLIVFALVTQILRFIAPVLVGILFAYFGAPSHEAISPETLEAVGNIANLVFSGYVGFKTYKKIVRED